MSYDYLLVNGLAGSGLEALLGGALSKTIGPAESVKASISRLFASVRWIKGPGNGWLGRADEAEFLFLVEPSGEVRMIQMSRCERDAVQRVAKELA